MYNLLVNERERHPINEKGNKNENFNRNRNYKNENYSD